MPGVGSICGLSLAACGCDPTQQWPVTLSLDCLWPPLVTLFGFASLTAATDVLAIPIAGFHDAHNCGKAAHDATYILSTAELRADGFLSRRVATTRYLVLIRSEEAPNSVAQIGTGATLADNYGIPSRKPTLSIMREYRPFSSVHNMGGHALRPSGFEPFRRPDLLAAGWHGAVVRQPRLLADLANDLTDI
jgi:hypothetical protein